METILSDLLLYWSHGIIRCVRAEHKSSVRIEQEQSQISEESSLERLEHFFRLCCPKQLFLAPIAPIKLPDLQHLVQWSGENGIHLLINKNNK